MANYFEYSKVNEKKIAAHKVTVTLRANIRNKNVENNEGIRI